jgi:hypothetical protein
LAVANRPVESRSGIPDSIRREYSSLRRGGVVFILFVVPLDISRLADTGE